MHMSLVLYALCSSSSRVALCKTPGCFLQSLSDPGTSYCRSFKQKKEELTSKLYQLYNTSVFDSKVSQTFTYLLSTSCFVQMSSVVQIFCSVYLFVTFSYLSTCQSLGIRKCAKRQGTALQGRSEEEEIAMPALNCQRKSVILQVPLHC